MGMVFEQMAVIQFIKIQTMKKIFCLAVVAVFLASCGPKRMSCYGKRCVDTSKKADSVRNS